MLAGLLPGGPELETLDVRDVFVVVRADLPEDVVHAVACILGETWQQIEGQYAHLAPERSLVTHPLNARTTGVTPIALHPGAAGYIAALPHPRLTRARDDGAGLPGPGPDRTSQADGDGRALRYDLRT